MEWLLRVLHRRRLKRTADRPPGMSVTLSVLPSRTAVVVLDADSEIPSRALDRLVNRAVRDAFVFEAVDAVEVRRRTGELLFRRHRDHEEERAAAGYCKEMPPPQLGK